MSLPSRFAPAALLSPLLVLLAFAARGQGLAREEQGLTAVGVFHLGTDALPEVKLSRPACQDPDCPWWVYGNTYGVPQQRTVGLVFRTISFGPISSRMHCFHAGCNGAISMFPDASDNFNVTGDYYCTAAYYGGFTPEEICNLVAPGAYVIHGRDFPFEAEQLLAGGFKTGGDRTLAAYLKVHDIHFIYEGPPAPVTRYYFGADTNLNPLSFPREETSGYDFYAGRLGKGPHKCRIHKNGWDVLRLPDQVPVPPDEKCAFQFEVVEDMIAKAGPETARRRTYAYWFLFGPKGHEEAPRQWGSQQAKLLLEQVHTYREWIGGTTLFADIEPPIDDPSGDTWPICATSSGEVVDAEACDKNQAVLEGFLEYLARLKALSQAFGARRFAFEPGVYTRPEAWILYFGVDFIPEVVIPRDPRSRRSLAASLAPDSQKQPFVLWITGCATGEGTYKSEQAEDIQERDLFRIVHQTSLGGSQSILWQYHIEKPDFDVTTTNPDRFLPVSSAVPYNCSCSDPNLFRVGVVGSCPPLNDRLVETLAIPSDGSVVASRSYPSYKTFRVEVSGTYRWGLCDAWCCPGGDPGLRERHGDAEFLTEDCWISHYGDFNGTDISVFVDGENVDWGPFQSDHVYSIEVAGRDAPFSFHINDCASCYGDNEGSLTVRIYELTP